MPDITVDKINSSAKENKKAFIEACESFYKGQLNIITDKISKVKGRVLVMLAGPSSSGKTTTAKILKKDLEEKGRHAIVISLDDFYRDQTESFYFEDGTIDYETIRSIDIPYVTKCMENLLHKGQAMIPHFSFKT